VGIVDVFDALRCADVVVVVVVGCSRFEVN